MDPSQLLNIPDLLAYSGLMLSFDIVLFGIFFSAQKRGLSELIRRTGVHVFASLVAVHSLAVLACLANLIGISLYINVVALGITLGTFLFLGLMHLTRGFSAGRLDGFFTMLYGSGSEKPGDMETFRAKCNALVHNKTNMAITIFLRCLVVFLLVGLSWLGKYLFDGDWLENTSFYSISWIIGVFSTLFFMKYSFGAFLPMTSCDELSSDKYVKKLVWLIGRATQTIFCSTFGFSTMAHGDVAKALSDARAKGISITVLGAEEVMDDNIKKRLYEIGAFLYLTQQRILDMNNIFWNHIFIVDGIHWLWLFPHIPKPHEPESKVHSGYVASFDRKAESYLDHFKIIPRKKYPVLDAGNSSQEIAKSK